MAEKGKPGRPGKKIPPQDIQEATVISETNITPPSDPSSSSATPNTTQQSVNGDSGAPPPPSDKSGGSGWDPLTSEPVISRGYGAAPAAPVGGNQAPVPEIPEPRVNIPSPEAILNEPQPKVTTPPPPPVNPDMTDLSHGDKRKAAESAVGFIFQIWTWLNDFARKKVQIDMKDMEKLHEQAKIDINMKVSANSQITFRDVIQDFNNQTTELFIVTEKFKNEVREPMIREFMKRDIGLTDMQKIIAYWALEGIQKTAQFVQSKKLGNQIIQDLMDLKATFDRNSRPAPAPAAAPQPASGQPSPPPTPAQPAPDAPIAPASEYKEPGEGNN